MTHSCNVNNNLSFVTRFTGNCKWILFFGILMGSIRFVYPQQSDFQFWPQVQVGYNLSNDFKISLEEEVRLRENASQIRKELTDLGLTYKVNKFFRLSLNYRLELTYKNPDERSWRNGLYLDIMLRKGFQRFQADYRIRFQSPKIETISEVSSLNQWLKNRHKISLQYDIKGIPLAPKIEAELFIPIARQQSLMIDEYRLWAGLSYALNKRNEISIRYGIQQEVNVADPLRAYILGISYSLDIN
jgi:hypothetical protein